MEGIVYLGEWLERRADGLLRKPKGWTECVGCDPEDPWGFVPDEYIEGAEVLFHYQNPGEYEEAGQRCVDPLGRNKWVSEPDRNRPLIGPTGYEFDRNYLPLARLERGKNVSVSNTLRCRFKGQDGKRNNNMPSSSTLYQATLHCTQAHFKPPESTRLIVAGGEHAWNHLTGGAPGTVSEWRGYTVSGFGVRSVSEEVKDSGPEVRGRTHYGSLPILATFHLALLGRDPKMVIPTKRDFAKIPLILRGEWPKPLPACFRPRTEDDLVKLHDWFDVAECAERVTLDTEYLEDSNDFIYMIGIGYKDESKIIHGIQLWRTKACKEVIAAFINRLWNLTKRVPMTCQNLVADVNAMQTNFRMGWDHYFLLHDTMQANTVLWSSPRSSTVSGT
ncbi:hypothetical protein LCGC14_1378060 [marine sediment metagenome]|uniref:Uncharacterized protein n=1 Tax=marine sediment metagenome TaxID=412755 RepID=A0A0F9KPD6_9ZZZZ